MTTGVWYLEYDCLDYFTEEDKEEDGCIHESSLDEPIEIFCESMKLSAKTEEEAVEEATKGWARAESNSSPKDKVIHRGRYPKVVVEYPCNPRLVYVRKLV